MAPIPFRSDKDGVYNWPQYSRGSKKPATHTQQKITHVSPLGGVSNTYSSAIISILAMVPLSIFFQLLSLLIATLQVHISWILYPRVGHRRPLIFYQIERLLYEDVFFKFIAQTVQEVERWIPKKASENVWQLQTITAAERPQGLVCQKQERLIWNIPLYQGLDWLTDSEYLKFDSPRPIL